ncbi:AMIN domain-containing protein [Tropicimonas sp.]|uniref:N-acetylmuramoyl-L-alanine amidase n=1 Tax=Tropicimonas sp. TaxID=2067044 RepID=UPI003A862C4A
MLRNLCLAALAALMLAFTGGARAEEPFAVAILDTERSAIKGRDDGFDLILTLSEPVPYRVATLDDPPRLVLDFRDLDMEPLQTVDLGFAEAVGAVRRGTIQAGWSRLVIDLTGPFAIDTADTRTGADDGSARIELALRKVDPAVFSARSNIGAAHSYPPAGTDGAAALPQAEGPLRVVIDPGADTDAAHDDTQNPDPVFGFAGRLREALGGIDGTEVMSTGDHDIDVSLRSRLDSLHSTGSVVLLSLRSHPSGDEAGGRHEVCILSESDGFAAPGVPVDPSEAGQGRGGDGVAELLMSIARADTVPRSDALAEALAEGFRQEGIDTSRHARAHLSYSVPMVAEVPSVLIELGFPPDAGKEAGPRESDWQSQAVAAIVAGLRTWAEEDRAHR